MTALRPRHFPGISLVLTVLLSSSLALPARSDGRFHLGAELTEPRGGAPPAFGLGLEPTGRSEASGAPSPTLGLAELPEDPGAAASPSLSEPPTVPDAETTVSPRKDHRWFVLGGFTLAFLGLEYMAFWSSATVNDEFTFRDEGWFGQYTYAGGADKASHLVGGYITGRLVESALVRAGTPASTARILSAATIAVTGTLIEVGDAYHGFGFSWQDALITAAGGVAGSLLAKTGWDDTVTMRFGMVGKDVPDDTSLVYSEPNHYSGEIYTADLRFAGLFPRLKKDPGFARYFLFSLTYGSKGYPWADESIRQRLLGFELGLDLHQVALALGVPPDTWWGAPILAFFKYFRLPFTGIGFQYELNSSRWKGPNSFYRYDF